MDRFLHEETSEGGEAGAAPVVETPQVEAPQAEAPAEQEAWSGPSQEDWQQAQQEIGWLREQREAFESEQGQDYQYGQPQGEQQQAPQFQPAPDPSLEPERFQAWFEQQQAQHDEQLLQRLSPALNYYAQAQAREQIDQGFQALPEDAQISRYLPEGQEETAREALQGLASAYVDPRDPNPDVGAALTQGAQTLKGLLTAAGEKAVADYKASLSGGGDQAREPGVQSSGIEAVDVPGTYDQINENYQREIGVLR